MSVGLKTDSACPFETLDEAAAPADSMNTTSWETLNQRYPAKLHPETEVLNVWRFKPLSFGVICYTVIDN